MASGPLPSGAGATGLKMFIYAVGQKQQQQQQQEEVSFLAQLVLVNETGEITVTVKNNSTGALSPAEAAKILLVQIIASLAAFRPINSLV
jgi:hypothetical protein